MKKWKMRFTPESARLLSKLHPENKKLIKQVLTELRQNPHAGKDLQEELSGFKSLRLKQYRIIYNVVEEKKSSEFIISVVGKMSMNNSSACSSNFKNLKAPFNLLLFPSNEV